MLEIDGWQVTMTEAYRRIEADPLVLMDLRGTEGELNALADFTEMMDRQMSRKFKAGKERQAA